MEKGKFTITMEYLREIVAKRTFRNSPAAALRELIQNAHDACLVASALSGKTDYAVHITLDPSEKTITIQDNGVGMTASDILEYLTKVGGGKKGTSIAEKYKSARNSRRLDDVVGEFGFGFIAAFIIADRIELWTRCSQDGSPGLYCIFSTEGVEYEYEEVSVPFESGTKLVLYLNHEVLSRGYKPTDNPIAGSVLRWDTVDAIVKKYCVLLEFPIYVTHRGEETQAPSNRIEIPWEAKGSLKESLQDFYATRTGKDKIGEVLHVIRFSRSRQRGDAASLEGALFFEKAPVTEEVPGNLEVFVKRMWVCEREQALLPAWASFMSGIIVTPELRPMPGRDELDREHESFDRIRNTVCEIVCDAFIEIARNNQRLFNMMFEQHAQIFRWGLVVEKKSADKDKRVFREAELLRYVRFKRYGPRYTEGNRCDLNDLISVRPSEPIEFKDRKRVVNIVARPVPADRQLEFRRFLSSRALDVVVPSDESEIRILSIIHDVFDDVIVSNIEDELIRNFANLLEGDQRSKWQLFLKYYKSLAEKHRMGGVEIGEFEPEYMPAMVLNVPASSAGASGTTAETEEPAPTQRSPSTDSPWACGVPAGLANSYKQTLVINSKNATMKLLLDYLESSGLDKVDEVLDVCLHECYHMALQSALDTVFGETLKHHVEISSAIIQNSVKSHKERARDASADRTVREELQTLRVEREAYRVRYGELEKDEMNQDTAFQVPSGPSERMGVVVFCDMVGSTGSVVGMDFDERGLVLNDFVKLAKQEVRKQAGFFDKFTGDGLIALFGVDQQRRANGDFDANEWQKACCQAWVFCKEMSAAMAGFNNQPSIRRVIDRNPHKVKQFEVRIAASAAPVLFGSFGGRGTAVGVPVVVAARLCAEKPAFEAAQSAILVDDTFRTHSGMSDFDEVKYEFVPRGIETRVHIFRQRARV